MTPPLVLEARKVCGGGRGGKPRPMESIYLFADWHVQPGGGVRVGGAGRGQDGDTRQRSGSP